ncbi:MAG: 16S rRNA (guanine(527)-N(7))-methyltransferase RsmG, partial [Methylocystaceae bacterium]
LDLLYEKNQQINLVSRQLSRADLDYHWQDAMAGLNWIMAGQSCLDVGSGGGFPALPLAIAKPQSKFVLIEAEQKKVFWLEEARQEMKLVNVEIIRGRAETLARDGNLREKFDIVTARAVAELRVLLEYTLPFVKVGGKLIAWKGPAAAEELAAARIALSELKGRLKQQMNYEVDKEKRCLLIIEKMATTPQKYPRMEGTPKKRPL